MPKRKLYRLIVSRDCHDWRLDQFIAASQEDFSRRQVRDLIDLGGVHCSGRRVHQCGRLVKEGESIEVHVDGAPVQPFRLGQQDVLYRDRWLLSINKPSGVEMQPTPARFKGTLYEAAQQWLKDPYRPQDKPELAMVQRLDRETSGVVLFSIHPKAHKPLTEAFSQRRVHKTYLALVSGQLPDSAGEFNSQLARARATNKMKSVARGGKEAITRYRLLQQYDRCCLVWVEIPTGRTHQIRVHFSEAGHPLVGDTLYKTPASVTLPGIQRTLLHSWRLQCLHPVEKQDICLAATLPDDFSRLLAQLGGSDVDLSAY
ncbi:MAG: RluA family pseudouridine synthase [Desulfuromonadaceae bacterium]|nr:RluA family pseudouridine synthase [Desulfuromonadaceae bacterium]